MSESKTISREQLQSVKLANTKYPIDFTLRRRCSTFAFDERPVEVEKLQQLFEAARWAPSSYNEQPWSFLLTTRTDSLGDYERLLSCLLGNNADWAHRAPVLILSVAKRHFDAGGKVNHYSIHDVGLATENLAIQATALDLFVHLVAGFDRPRVRELFVIPETHEPVCVIAIGYFGNVETLPSDIQQRESASRKRREFSDFVFSSRWGQRSELIQD